MSKITYRFVEIEETFGLYETESSFVVSAPENQIDDVLDQITHEFRGKSGSPDGSFDYEVDGIRVQLVTDQEIPKEDFDVLKKYLADLSPSCSSLELG